MIHQGCQHCIQTGQKYICMSELSRITSFLNITTVCNIAWCTAWEKLAAKCCAHWMWNPAPRKSPMASYFKEENYVNIVNSTVCRRMFPTANMIKKKERYCDIYSVYLSICRCSRILFLQQRERLLASVAGSSVPSVLNLTFRLRIKSRLPFAGIIRRLPYFTLFRIRVKLRLFRKSQKI